jgi:hypothetical protein
LGFIITCCGKKKIFSVCGKKVIISLMIIKNMAGIGFIILCFYEEKYEKGKEQLLQAVTF